MLETVGAGLARSPTAAPELEVEVDSRWAVLALLVGIRLSLGIQFQSVVAVGALLVGPLLTDFGGLGILIGIVQLPGAVVALPGGWMAARLGDRRILLVGLALMVAGGTGLALAPSLLAALAGRLLAGAGHALVNLVLTKGAMDRFAGTELTTAMGWLLAAWPCGIALCMVLLPPIGAALGWRAALLLAAVPALLGLLVIAAGRYGRGYAQNSGIAGQGTWPLPATWPPLLMLATAWTGFNASLVIVLGFTPPWLVTTGLDPTTAAWMASLAGWAAVPFLPLGGWFAEYLGSPFMLTIAAVAVMTAGVATLPLAPAPMLVIFGVCCGLGGGPLVSLAAAVLSPEQRSLGLGAFYTLYGVGMAALPGLAGLARDRSGQAFAPLWVAVAILAFSLLALAGFGIERRRAGPSGGTIAVGPGNTVGRETERER